MKALKHRRVQEGKTFDTGAMPVMKLFLSTIYGKFGMSEADEAAFRARNAFEMGRWHHVAGVIDDKESRLYMNGELISTQILPTG